MVHFAFEMFPRAFGHSAGFGESHAHCHIKGTEKSCKQDTHEFFLNAAYQSKLNTDTFLSFFFTPVFYKVQYLETVYQHFPLNNSMLIL